MRSRKGLTLIELLIVVIILGALAAIAIPRISTSATTAKSNACKTNISTLNTALEMYHVDHGDYPDALTGVTSDVNYFSPTDVPKCPFTDTVYDSGYTKSSGRVAAHSH
jgi:type II secretion system protein G